MGNFLCRTKAINLAHGTGTCGWLKVPQHPTCFSSLDVWSSFSPALIARNRDVLSEHQRSSLHILTKKVAGSACNLDEPNKAAVNHIAPSIRSR